MPPRKTWRPKFKVGDFARLVYVPRHSGFYVDDEVRVMDRDVRQRSLDPRPNRYMVVTLHRNPQVKGWFYEDDLEAS